jgi:hypothetical protein
MATKAYAYIMFRLGGAALDPSGGEAVFTRRIAALDINVGNSPYQCTDVQTIVNGIMAAPSDAKIIVGGDSLGANNTPYVCQALIGHRKIDYIFGFQPSLYGMHALIPANVVEARCIYNPNPLATAGLGAYQWACAEGNTTTKLHIITTSDPHPGDDDIAMQNLILADIQRIITPPTV